MVAKITTGKSMRGALSYNENKVKQQKAECIGAVNFGKEAGELNFHEKLTRFINLTRWKPKVRTNTVHVSLNFHPSERLSGEALEQIARAYMNKVGFGDQPYLIYQHFDAAHPHIHIVSTNVRKNGSRIDLHNIGRLRSEPARQSIEKEFKLLPAEDSTVKSLPTESIPKYGRQETRRSMVSFVTMVARTYRYTSLAEFNAALSQFNLLAHRGDEGSRMFQKEGLVYSFTEKGTMIGVPMKASSIHSKPTLKYLKRQFKLNEALRSPARGNLVRRVAIALHGRPTLTQFTTRLQKEKIFLVLRASATGQVFGATFVDNKTKTVFNGSDLSKELGAKGLLEKLSTSGPSVPSKTDLATGEIKSGPDPHTASTDQTVIAEVLNDLLSVQKEFESIQPYKRKRKKRRSQKNR